MSTETIATATLILIGACVMGFSLRGTRVILRLVERGRFVNGWRILYFLMLFFLLGYLASVFFVLSGFSKVLALLTGVIFLVGACFVNLVVRLGHRTIGDLLATTVSNTHFEKIIDSMVGALVVTDSDFVIRKINRATSTLSGYAEEELVGETVDAVFSGCDLLVRREELLRQGYCPDVEKECRTRDGHALPVSVSASIMRGSGGEIEGAVFVFQDIRERKRLEHRLFHNATHDSLTGLPNRALFTDRLRRAVEHAQRHEGDLFAVLYLDVDRFKFVNDTLGHTIGDELLTTLGERLQECVRKSDTVARLGGDEFVILIEEIKDISDAIRVADRIRRGFSAPVLICDQELSASASIGIVLSESGYARHEDVLRDADVAMYRAKAMGGARYEVFDGAMRDRITGRLANENELRRALERDELQVHYQPIVDVKGNRLVGFESLVRWNHPQRGLVPPLEFVPLAEEMGLIVAIDRWVMRTACRQLREWQRAHPMDPPLSVSVNLSCKQFQRPDLVSFVDEVVRDAGLKHGDLKLEITESAFIGHHESITDTLKALKTLGVDLSIDDFGTGYSSLSYLHRLPIDTLKIDRSFIREMTDCGSNLAIVHTILLLAQALDIRVVAEGVENGGQLDQLSGLNCDFVQGYFFSRPLPADAAGALIAADRCGNRPPASLRA